MRIGSVLENQNFEKRIAITPEIAKKYIAFGFEVFLSKNYGAHLAGTVARFTTFCLGPCRAP